MSRFNPSAFAVAILLGLFATAQVAEAQKPRSPVERRLQPNKGFWDNGAVQSGSYAGRSSQFRSSPGPYVSPQSYTAPQQLVIPQRNIVRQPTYAQQPPVIHYSSPIVRAPQAIRAAPVITYSRVIPSPPPAPPGPPAALID